MATKRTRKRLSESNTLSGAPVLESEGVIRGAKIVGLESVNGRFYKPDALRNAMPLYEGARVNLDHPSRDSRSQERKFTEWVGVIENVTEGSDGLYGDINLRQKSKSYEEIIEASTCFPEHFGLSHVADCEYESVQGVDHVHAIEEVVSVDIVLEPATTNGLFESKGNQTMARKTKKTFRSLVESAPAYDINRKRLQEMIEGEDPVIEPEAVAEVDSAGTPEDAVRQGLLEAISIKLDTASAEQLQGVLIALELPTGAADIAAGEAADSEMPPIEDTEEIPVEEKALELEAKVSRLEAKELLFESRVEPTEPRIKAVAACKPSDRKELVESFPVIGGGYSYGSNGRPRTSPPANGAGGSGGTVYESRWNERAKAAREQISR